MVDDIKVKYVFEMYDDNKNGCIICVEVWVYGIVLVDKFYLVYLFMYDVDGDGIVCE